MACNIYSSIRRIGVTKTHIQDVVARTLAHIGNTGVDVSIHTVGKQRIRTLNRLFRGIDRPTDVLSFPANDVPQNNDIDAGDVFVCPEYIQKQAKRFEVSFQEEFDRMLIHGILHLRGYDHVTKKQAKRMFAIQEHLCEQVNAYI